MYTYMYIYNYIYIVYINICTMCINNTGVNLICSLSSHSLLHPFLSSPVVKLQRCPGAFHQEMPGTCILQGGQRFFSSINKYQQHICAIPYRDSPWIHIYIYTWIYIYMYIYINVVVAVSHL